MRRFVDLLIAVLLTGFYPAALPNSAGAQSTSPVAPILLLGDRVCLDIAHDCRFPGVNAIHRFLHLVLHDVPGNDDWRVQAGATCSTAVDLTGGTPIGPDGYLETVVDLQTTSSPLYLHSACFILRGRHHWGVTYYAAYLDDTPQPDADTAFPGYRSLTGRPDLPDLDILYIHRSPSLAYDAPQKYPAEDQTVTFEAHVLNAGGVPAPAFSYAWILDGRIADTRNNTEPLLAGREVILTFPWHWRNGPHDLTLRLFPQSQEVSSSNNHLTIRTDALALGFWVERSAYTYFQDHQWGYCQALLCAGSNSFGDWLERQVLAWNQLLAHSDAEYAPAGAADRIRVDEIEVVPDGALPLAGSVATNTPDTRDHSVDLEWGLPSSTVATVYPDRWEGRFDVDWSLLHELNHARSMADLYRFDVPVRQDTTLSVVGNDGKPAWDALHPFDTRGKLVAYTTPTKETFLYQNREQDLMSCTCSPRYSAYSLVTLNRLRGRRASCANTNPPCNLGDWFIDIPPVNVLRLLDGSGHTLANGSLKLYFDHGTSYSGHIFDQQHSATVPIEGGLARLPFDPFHTGGSPAIAAHTVLLLEVISGSTDKFCFVEPALFNLAYWTGYRDAAHPAAYIFHADGSDHNACRLDSPPVLVNEPFATSPYASRVHLGGTGNRRLTVQLLDDASPPHAMRNRRVVVQDGVHRLGQASTGPDGQVTFTLPPGADRFQIIDRTDNNLMITRSATANPPVSMARKR